MLFREPKRFFYRVICKNSIFVHTSEICMATGCAERTIQKVIEMYRPKSVLDLGCGVGKAVDSFYSKGIDAMGIEGSKMLIKMASNPQLIRKYNLEKELKLNKKFDLIWSHEFIEHIHPKYINNLLKTFSNHSDIIIMTAAKPGQGGEGHFNEQSSEYWINQFRKYGYTYNHQKTDELRKIREKNNENLLVLER